MAEPAITALVHTPQGLAGQLRRDNEYQFDFAPSATPECAPALGMTLNLRANRQHELHPIFQMNMPEGFVLEQMRSRLSMTAGVDPLRLLTVAGSHDPIGRLCFTQDGHGAMPDRPEGVRLADLLSKGGSTAQFARLLDHYLLSTCISGVQPKVLVPEQSTQSLIVKSGLDAFPGLAINEFVCMSIVRSAGVPVPEFHLSGDGELFVMRRFDRPADGRILGFEDMLALAGRSTEQKYTGSYELVLRLLKLYCSPEHLPAARQQLFDMVVLSCLLDNGDAHMKNFGVLYDGIAGAVRMAPAYDIVCTRVYIPEDNLALDLAGNRSFFAARVGLIDFAARCDIPRTQAIARICELAQLALDSVESLAGQVQRLPGLREVIEKEARLHLQTFTRSNHA